MRASILLCLLLPFSVDAAVIVSEIAWMGDSISANHEWIELHNTGGAAVDVTGWTLTDGMNLSIPLLGSIEAGQYAVLERTSDDSASGAAFLVYTGALVNTGATVQLKRADGSLEDQVAGGENWQGIGGDNATKETAQYTTSGWVTGVATPGASNSGVSLPKDTAQEESGDSATDTEGKAAVAVKKNSSSETVRLVLRDVSLQLAVESQSVGYVNQEISFAVTPSGIGDVLVDSLQYDWNFGDGTTAHSKAATHSFSYPGKYVVTVYGGYKRQEQVARHEITILPVTMSLTKSQRGDIQIHNDSPYEIDISLYQVEGAKTFVFPKYSVILPKQTITIPHGRIGGSVLKLKDSQGTVVTTYPGHASLEEVETQYGRPIVSHVLDEKSGEGESWFAPLLDPSAYVLNKAIAATTSATDTDVLSYQNQDEELPKETSVPPEAWPYFGLIGVMILGLVGLANKASR